MSCEIQISVRSGQSGNPITLKPFPNSGYGNEEKPEAGKFVYVRILDANVEEVEDHIRTVLGGHSLLQPWNRLIDWEQIAQDKTVDGYRLRIFTVNPNVSGRGYLTREQVEIYLATWNAVVQSITVNSVTFDIWAFEDSSSNPGVIQSEAFWGAVPVGVVFTEGLYNQNTGRHRITADYGNSWISDRNAVVNRGENNQGTVISHTEGVSITFDVFRKQMFDIFKRDIIRRLDNVLDRKQFYFPPGVISTIQGQGGFIEATIAQGKIYLKNRLDD